MPRVGFESTTPVFERAKTVHALASTVIGIRLTITVKYWNHYKVDFNGTTIKETTHVSFHFSFLILESL
jgi:uncharacterized membrane protein